MCDDLTQELQTGINAARAVAEHMERMGGAGRTEWSIPYERGVYVVSVDLIAYDWDTGRPGVGAGE